MPTFAVTIDHTGAITDVQPSSAALHETAGPVPTEEGTVAERIVHADNANAAREIVQAQLDVEREVMTAPEAPPPVEPPPPMEPEPPPEEGI